MTKKFSLKRFLLWIAASIFITQSVAAYEVGTHEEMSGQAARSSSLNKYLSLIGLKSLEDELTDTDTKLSIVDWIRQGANSEDDTLSLNFARYRNHFYNPLSGLGLNALGSGEPSPDWGLENTRDFATQRYSFKDARQYFYDALTLTDKDNREMFMARTFYTLGHVIHLIQDMAQPQHTRNDSHGGGIFGPSSRYEKYTDWKDIRPHLPFTGYAPVYSETDTTTFTTPRQFWSTTPGNGNGGKGIAEYSNRGFFSAGTLPGKGSFTSPSIDISTRVDADIATLCATVTGGKPACPPRLSGTMTFFSNTVTDTLRSGMTTVNARVATYSLFDQDLKDAGTDPVFSLNRFNFDAAHAFLIPRAVAYSAGLINYFFRGKIDFVPDPDKTGFYRIKNLGNEDMSGVFALYYDAVDGKRHKVPGASWNVWVVKNGQSDPRLMKM